MRKRATKKIAFCLAGLMLSASAYATDVEVTHWWTTGAEAAAVRELARIFEANTGNKWVDGAIAGSGPLAKPVIMSRILGGDPMAATQLNHGKESEELIKAGLVLDLTEIADKEKWREIIRPKSLLDSCTYEGHIYCLPLNIHSSQWMWISTKAFADSGIPVAHTWEELKAAAPKLRAAGKVPLAIAGQSAWEAFVFYTLITHVGGKDLYYKVFRDRDEATLKGEMMKQVFEELAIARDLSKGTNVKDWNLATAKVINGEAAAQIMGDWALSEFAAAGKQEGKDFECVIGFGGTPYILTDGDAFYFPVNRSKEVTEAQKQLVETIASPEAQLAFNLKKGSLPVRDDVDMEKASPCMKKGLASLRAGHALDAPGQSLTPDAMGQITDLMAEFFGSAMTPEVIQTRFTQIILEDQ